MSKTQSKFGVTISNFNSIGNIEFRNLNQTITAGDGYEKFDLDIAGGVVLNNSNGLLITDTVNNGFISAIKTTKWLVTYSGYVNNNLVDVNKLQISGYVNGLSIVSSVSGMDFEANTGIIKPFSKTFITDIPLGQTFDLRAAATTTNLNIRITLVLTQLS